MAWNAGSIVLLLLPLLISARIGGAHRVVTRGIHPVGGATVCSSARVCTETDDLGEFNLHQLRGGPGWRGVIRVSKAGFGSRTLTVSETDLPLEVQIEERSDSHEKRIQNCPTSSQASGERWVGIAEFRVQVAPTWVFKEMNDEENKIRLGILHPPSSSEAIHFAAGADSSDGLPERRLLKNSKILEDLNLVWDGNEAPALVGSSIQGVDIRGHSMKYWRFVGTTQETVGYQNLSLESARLFDEILESLCRAPTIR